MSLRNKFRALTLDPKALTAAADTIRLFRHVNDMQAFRTALEAEEYDRALEHTDLSKDEFHERVSSIRERAVEVGEEHSDVATASPEEIDEATR
jgi:hypothetical protein